MLSASDDTRRQVKSHGIELGEIEFAVDTALSWEGNFPEAGKETT